MNNMNDKLNWMYHNRIVLAERWVLIFCCRLNVRKNIQFDKFKRFIKLSYLQNFKDAQYSTFYFAIFYIIHSVLILRTFYSQGIFLHVTKYRDYVTWSISVFGVVDYKSEIWEIKNRGSNMVLSMSKKKTELSIKNTWKSYYSGTSP